MNSGTTFAHELIDIVADATTKETIGKTVPQDEKSEQRETYTGLVRDLPCLRNKGVVDTVLNQLNGVQTHGDFLEAMKVIEPLVARVRRVLTEAQILVDSRDPFAPLEFIESQSTRTVSTLERLTAQERAQSQQIAVSFLNRILPLLGQKLSEVRGNAHRVGEGVFHGNHDFSTVSYGVNSQGSDITDAATAIWNNVKFKRGSKGHKLLQLCSGYQPGAIINMDVVAKKLYEEEIILSKELKSRLNQALYQVLMHFAEGRKPFVRLRGGGAIQISHGIDNFPLSELSEPILLNQAFLNAPILMEKGVILKASKIVSKKLTTETVAELNLSEDAQLVVKYFLSHADVESVSTSNFLTAIRKAPNFILELSTVIDTINYAFEQQGIVTRIQRTGSTISITHS